MVRQEFRFFRRSAIRIALPSLMLLASCANEPAQAPQAGLPAHSDKKAPASAIAATFPVPAMHTKIYTKTLSNGLTVFVVPRPDLPLISFRIGIRAGSAEDPLGKGGTASLAASLLVRGTKEHDALSIFRIIDDSGGSLEASAERDMTVLSGDSLSSETPDLLSLASEMVASPTFPPDEFAQKKANYIASLIDSEDHPGPKGLNLFFQLLYGKGPYGHPASGTSESLRVITRQDLVDFVRSTYRPDRSVLVLAGALTPKEGFRLASKYLGPWSSPSTIAGNQSSPSAPDTLSSGVFLIDKPELRQSTVFYGLPGIARKDPDFYNDLVFNMVLGGTNTSTLNRVIRQKKGLVYYIHSELLAERKAGPFLINFQTHAPNTKKVLTAMNQVLDNALSTPPSQDKVDAVKNQLVGGFPFLMNTTSKLASLLLILWKDDLGLTYFTDYPAEVRKVNPDSALAAGQKLLRNKSFVTVIVGPKKTLNKAGVTGLRPPAPNS